jgi:SAM-dependent methyltransferase
VIALCSERGEQLALDSARWFTEADQDEREVLGVMEGPVLDVGCGPGRVLAALGRAGVPALGVDPSPAAVALARARGGVALERSVFDRLPGEGRWMTVVLLDGNIGIGGNAVRLLRRCRTLMASEGRLVAEVGPPGAGWRTHRVRLERGAARSPWFNWTVVGAEVIDQVAAQSGLEVTSLQRLGSRWFAVMGLADAAA